MNRAAIILRGRTLDDFRHLFPKPTGVNYTVKEGATVSDTLRFIPMVVNHCKSMVKNYVDQELKGLSVYDACERLWYFTKYLIDYERDEFRFEQIKSASRLVGDGKGDCDCKTSFVNSCIAQYGITNGIINRITAYDHTDNFSHIYSLIPDGKGKYIIMDCVWTKFNAEKPYTKKEDHIMELQFLDGIGDTNEPTRKGIDALAFSGMEDDLLGLGKIKRGGSGAGKKGGLFHKKTPEQKTAKKEHRKKIGQKLIKGAHAINKFNPATGLLRAGILASMKLNVFKVPASLKWGYATKEYAESKGMDMTKFDKVRSILNKLEKIFYAAGGKPENLKKAMLTGHGNRNHEVSGLHDDNESTPLAPMLGAIYQDEFLKGLEGFGDLGDPATATSLAAASATMGTIAALLKTVGPLFPTKKKKGNKAEAGGDQENTPAENQQTPEGNSEPEHPSENPDPVPNEETPAENPPDENADNMPTTASEDVEPTGGEDGANPDENSETPTTEEEVNGLMPLTGIKDFYEKNKLWVRPVAVVAGLVVAALIIDHINSTPKIEQQPLLNTPSINGIEKKKRKRREGGKEQNSREKQSIIALM